MGAPVRQGGAGALLSGSGGQADRRLPVGAHSDMQELPCHCAAAEDAVAVQEGQQARATDDGAK